LQRQGQGIVGKKRAKFLSRFLLSRLRGVMLGETRGRGRFEGLRLKC